MAHREIVRRARPSPCFALSSFLPGLSRNGFANSSAITFNAVGRGMRASLSSPSGSPPQASRKSAPQGFKTPPPPPKPARGDTLAVVGLGNPGKEYNGTRHNVGFDILQALATIHKTAFRSERSLEADVARFEMDNRTVLLVRPRTYMNSSGRSVRKLKLPKTALLIVADDMALEVGRLKLRPSGSAGGHNGLKSIETALGGREYARLRVGVGEARGGPGEWRDHVLGKFSRSEREQLEGVFIDSVNVIEEWIRNEEMKGAVDLLSRLMGRKKNNSAA